MAPRSGHKRVNFDVTPQQEAELDWLKESLGASSSKDAVLRAVRVLGILSRATSEGSQVYLHRPDGVLERLLLPELEVLEPRWTWLASRPHGWRSQLWVKGRRLLASTIWRDMAANEMSPEEAADNWDLPVEAIDEVDRYCKSHGELIAAEADEELRRLSDAGVQVGA